ncbi:hypothetical protein [Virgibacillus pantothenticus]
MKSVMIDGLHSTFEENIKLTRGLLKIPNTMRLARSSAW